MPKIVCKKCEMKDAQEWFSYLFGAIIFDVTKAKTMKLPIQEVSTETANQHVKYDVAERGPDEDGFRIINIMAYRVDEDHIGHVDMSKPIIFASMDAIDGAMGTHVLIDGSHRVAYAVRFGIKSLKCVVLDAEQAKSIMTVRVNTLWAKKRKGRKRKCTTTSAATK